MDSEIIVIGADGRFGSFLCGKLEKLDIWPVRVDKDTDLNSDVIWDTAKYVVFAVPMENLEDSLIECASLIVPGTIVIDVCSLKMFACEAMKAALSDDIEIIGTHPLFGPQSAKNGIAGQRIVLCNVSAQEETFINFSEWLTEIGLKTIVCSPEYHDKQMAVSQALTHFIGKVAERTGIERIPLATKSFDDLMDIIELVKGGSAELFENMQQMNPYAKEVNENFLKNGQKLFDDLFFS